MIISAFLYFLYSKVHQSNKSKKSINTEFLLGFFINVSISEDEGKSTGLVYIFYKTQIFH